MFDIGVNLTSSQFSRDHDEVVARALAAGVNGMLLTGTNLAESQQAQKLASRYSGCWSTAGVHPHDGSSWTPAVAEAIYTLAGEPQVVAIGECGLDFNRNFSTPHEQEVAFSAQLALAAELSMPVFLHCRDAHDRFLTLLKPWLEKIPGAVLHCLPAAAARCRNAWIWACLSVLPVGFAMSGGDWNCASCCRRSRRNVCCWRPMRLICCRAISSRNRPRGVTSPRICRISWPASRPGAARRRNGWRRKRTQTSGRCLASTLTAFRFSGSRYF